MSAAAGVVCLIGPRGAGKTSVGRRLAALLGVAFADLDEELARRHAEETGEEELEAGRLLAALGEPAFRELERAALVALLEDPPGVLATGGGVVEREDNRRLLAGRARCVYLRADPLTLGHRIGRDPTFRPALEGVDPKIEMARVMRRREPWYRALAERVVDTEGEDVEAVAARIAGWLGR